MALTENRLVRLIFVPVVLRITLTRPILVEFLRKESYVSIFVSFLKELLVLVRSRSGLDEEERTEGQDGERTPLGGEGKK